MRLMLTGKYAALGILAAAALAPSAANAIPEYAAKEKVNCLYCHVAPGKARNFRGLYYRKNNHSFAEFDEAAEAKLAGVKAGSNGPDGTPTIKEYPNVTVAPVLNFKVKDIDGKPVNLARYQGDVILIVNVASKCGNTPQYAALESLYEKYKDKGFVVLGFPANDFGNQEPGTEKEIKEFCEATYKVKFPMFSKITVKGDAQAPLYKYLTSKETDPEFAGPIDWNFAKFLVNRKGKIIARFKAGVNPSSAEVASAIEKAVNEEKVAAETGKLVVVNSCPLTGEDSTSAAGGTVTFKNYKVNLCCAGCKDSFDRLTAAEKEKKIAEVLKK